jgi:hypothetical protein
MNPPNFQRGFEGTQLPGNFRAWPNFAGGTSRTLESFFNNLQP